MPLRRNTVGRLQHAKEYADSVLVGHRVVLRIVCQGNQDFDCLCGSLFGSLAISIGFCLESRDWRILPDFAEPGLLGNSGRYKPRQLGNGTSVAPCLKICARRTAGGACWRERQTTCEGQLYAPQEHFHPVEWPIACCCRIAPLRGAIKESKGHCAAAGT